MCPIYNTVKSVHLLNSEYRDTLTLIMWYHN